MPIDTGDLLAGDPVVEISDKPKERLLEGKKPVSIGTVPTDTGGLLPGDLTIETFENPEESLLKGDLTTEIFENP